MVRPKKKPSALLNDPLRIPMSASQKQLIRDAAEVSELEMAEWARSILFQAARTVVDGNDGVSSLRKPRKKKAV